MGPKAFLSLFLSVGCTNFLKMTFFFLFLHLISKFVTFITALWSSCDVTAISGDEINCWYFIYVVPSVILARRQPLPLACLSFLFSSSDFRRVENEVWLSLAPNICTRQLTRSRFGSFFFFRLFFV